MFGNPFGPPSFGGSSLTPKARELARKHGLNLNAERFIGSDGRIQPNARSAIEANLAFEQIIGGAGGVTGGCGQDPAKVPGPGKK